MCKRLSNFFDFTQNLNVLNASMVGALVIWLRLALTYEIIKLLCKHNCGFPPVGFHLCKERLAACNTAHLETPQTVIQPKFAK
jgi:hypothetical protein